MGEIKFRFWLGHTKKMTYEHSLIEISHAAWDFTEDIIPLQFTGLTDKNGKEIYEGDILILENILGNVLEDSETKKPTLYEVKKHGCDYILKRPYMDFIWGRLSRVEELVWDCEIIGNIYKNPELFK